MKVFRCPALNKHYFSLILFFFICQCGLAVPQTPLTPKELLYNVYLNGQDLDYVTLFVEEDNQLMVSREDLWSWGIEASSQPDFFYEERPFYALKSFDGANYKIDNRNLNIHIQMPSSAFKLNKLALRISAL